MHLQSLELFGFKSFADKTIFNFHEGVTAVVGPNGCGKSNLLDALRWVLGEQSAKSLRGGEMADVIFNGTDSRKPLGYAEVSLTLTDCSQDLGVDWHDVRVSRRIYRDGNSEYYLNKTLCRLKDIQNLFADTGVARSAYSMMEQGKIDMILSSRPEDRRAIFEEAAGITKYKSQKKEALRKLEATEANLLRIGDIIKEVKRQIGSLQRQAGKARRYQALLADLRVLDTHHSRKQLNVLETDLTNCRNEIERLNEKERSARGKIDSFESDLADRRSGLDEIDARIADGRAELERVQSEIAAHRSRIEFNRQRAQEIAELIERARAEITTAEAKREQQQSQMSEINTLVEKTAQLLATRRGDLAKLTQMAAEARTERDTRAAELETLHTAVSKTQSRIATFEDEISGIAIRRETTQERLRELDSVITQHHDSHSGIESALSDARSTTEIEQQQLERLQNEMQAAEKNLTEDRQAISETERALLEVERAMADKESRLEVLTQLNEEGEGLAQGSQALIKGLDDPKRFRSAIAGPLVSQLDVDRKFVAAIEAALGRNLHAIILQNAEDAPEIIAALTHKKLGRAALLLPQPNKVAEPAKSTLLPERALAWAIDKVKAPDSLQPLLQSLLRNVLVFENLDDAIRCQRVNPQFSAATLAGEFISAEGIIFAGSGASEKESLLARKSRIAGLSEEHATLKERHAAAHQQLEEGRSKIAKASTDLEHARAKHRAADIAQTNAGGKITLLERDLDEAARKIDTLLSEKTALRQQLDAADDRVSHLETELTSARKDFADHEEKRAAAETARKNALAQEEKTAAELNELRLTLATDQQKHDHFIAQREPMSARDVELNDTIAARMADISTYENRLASQANESKVAEASIEEQKRLQESRRDDLTALTAERAEKITALNQIEAELRGFRDSLNELHDDRAAGQVRESQLQMKIDNLAENVQRRYQVDLRGFVPDEAIFEQTLRVQLKRADKTGSEAPATPETPESPADPQELAAADIEKMVAELTKRLDDMGPVNLDAVQEYDELEERHKFLEEQNTDLTNARRELLDVIARINATTKKLFSETFAQVRVNFREMFAELFGGGRADLSLMDENDPLNCGIEISAKPPGKQLQVVSLLSGGERTMAAVALLFAIYMVRPSPFCVLDELDAPLDESNINRFIKVLERFVEQSQFIIITHNKRTIAKADILYGITMEERGVSKLVGMKLTERPTGEFPGPREAISTQRQFAMAENGNGNGNGHGEHATATAR